MKNIIKSLRKKIALYIIAMFFFPVAIFAETVLQWDRNDDADYYVLYWGNSPGDYSEGVSSEIPADTTEVPLENSIDGKIYYYSVKAFNYCGNSSDFSDELATAHLPNVDFTLKLPDNKSTGCFVNSTCR